MKKLIFVTVLTLAASVTFAGNSVRGYTRSDGTYVQGHTRSSPNANRYDNYGSESRGGHRRDEFSINSATNKTNSSYGWRDNDRDGVMNAYDRKPESKRGGW